MALDNAILGKEWNEQGNALINKADELIASLKNRFSFSRPALLERYVKAELFLHLHIRCFTSEFESKQFCAVCNRDDLNVTTTDGYAINVDIFARAANCQPGKAHCAANDVQEFMLIPNVELMEQPEWMEFNVTRISSRVRLQSLDNCRRTLSKGLYVSSFRGFILADGLGGTRHLQWVTDREVGAGIWRSSVGDYESPGQEVERSPEVVDQVSDDHAPLDRNLSGDTRAPNPFARLRVLIDDDAVWIETTKFVGFSQQVTEVLFGPLDFGSALP